MADSKISALLAVTSPVNTAQVAVNEGGISKRMTIAQILGLAAAGGDVTKVGTPVNDQVGVWTGDGTIEGVTTLTYDNVALKVGGGASNPSILNTAASTTVPTLIPASTDIDTGIGADGSDQLSLIAGGARGLRLLEVNSKVVQIPDADLSLTAFATGGQASATQLNTSYNVISTVATTGDSVKLPSVFLAGSIVFIKNDGANSCDVFPATGDDLGVGTNIAEALAAGESVAYIATVQTATWTKLIVSGGGDSITGITGGSEALPPLSFGDLDTGFSQNIDDFLILSLVGVKQFEWLQSGGIGQFQGATTGSGMLRNIVASATVPSLCPDQGDINTGIGQANPDSLSLIAGGIEGINIDEAGSIVTISFGNNTTATHVFTGDVAVNQAAGPIMLDEDASSTNPTLVPNRADDDTGIGWTTTDQLSLIAGGLSCISISEVAGARRVGFYDGSPVALQTGVAVTAGAIHAALVNLRLITA